MVQAVVESHATHNTFYPDWEIVKDRETEPEFPCVLWKQFTAALVNEYAGWKRTQLVQLWVITSVSTDRTPAQLQEAVEAADQAAIDIVLKISEVYGPSGVELSNVSITTMHDEHTQLLTGVVLSFSVAGATTCLDDEHFSPGPVEDCDPATVTVNGIEVASDATPCGSTIPIQVVDQNGNPVGSLVDGQWVVNIMDNILPYADEAAALADTSTVPETNQLVVITATGRTYWGDGASTVESLVSALKYILPVTEVPADKLLRVDVFGETPSIQLNS